MYEKDVIMWVLGIIGILALILMAGFAEGGNIIAAVVCIAIMLTAFHVGLFIDARKEQEKR